MEPDSTAPTQEGQSGRYDPGDLEVQPEVEEHGLEPEAQRAASPTLPLPDIPSAALELDLASIIGPQTVEEEKLQKRASNVLKLSQENDKLKAELKAMTDRIEAAERRRTELQRRQQKVMEAPAS